MDDRAERARRRSNWHVRIMRLDDVQGIRPGETTAAQRLEMMWELVVQAWAVAGKPIPDYERHEMPIRVLRLDELS